MLRSKIQEDLILSLKAKEQDKVDALRLLISEIKNMEIDLKKELSDEETIKVIRSMCKKLREAMDMFTKGGRDDLAQQNKVQLDIYMTYLPAELDDTVIAEKVGALMDENKELFKENPKMIIPTIMKALSSQAAPQKIMSEIQKRM